MTMVLWVNLNNIIFIELFHTGKLALALYDYEDLWMTWLFCYRIVYIVNYIVFKLSKYLHPCYSWKTFWRWELEYYSMIIFFRFYRFIMKKVVQYARVKYMSQIVISNFSKNYFFNSGYWLVIADKIMAKRRYSLLTITSIHRQ